MTADSLEQLMADAKRYRFLRDHHDCHFGWNSYGNVSFSIEMPLDDVQFTNGSENPDGLIDEIMRMKGFL